jgi:hypothetical protein
MASAGLCRTVTFQIAVCHSCFTALLADLQNPLRLDFFNPDDYPAPESDNTVTAFAAIIQLTE